MLITQQIKFLVYTRGPEEENIIKKSVEQTVTSPVHEDIYENVDETNEETFIGRRKY